MNTQQILNFDPRNQGISLDDLTLFTAELTNLQIGYETIDAEFPEAFQKKLDACNRELAERTRAKTEAELKRIETQLEGLKTPTERKAELQRRQAALTKQLSK